METEYGHTDLARDEVDGWQGAAVLEFGTNWCGHCQAAQSAARTALGKQAGLKHVKVEDGPGRPLGRSYRVKLWPTFVFLKDGQELGRLVRPVEADEFREPLASIT